MELLTLSNEELEHEANKIKDAVLLALEADEVLTQGQQEHLSKNLCVIRKDVSTISYIYSRILGKGKPTKRWVVSRIYNDYEPELRSVSE